MRFIEIEAENKKKKLEEVTGVKLKFRQIVLRVSFDV